jgi:hypothetical protein
MYSPSVDYANAPILYPRMAFQPANGYWYGAGYAQPHLHPHPTPSWNSTLAPQPRLKPAPKADPLPVDFLKELLASMPEPRRKPSGPSTHTHDHDHAPQKKKTIDIKRIALKLGAAAGFFFVARLLGKMPPAKNTFNYLTSDWKEWTKVALGIASMNQVNDCFGWKPPAWLAAIQTTLFVNPAVSGFTKKMALQTVLMAPLVSAIVAGTNLINDKLTQPIQENLHIPPTITRLAVMVSMMVLGIKAYPQLYRKVAETGMMGQEAKQHASKLVLGTEVLVCTRCGGSHLICMSEIGDYIGSMGNWFRSKHKQEKVTQ